MEFFNLPLREDQTQNIRTKKTVNRPNGLCRPGKATATGSMQPQLQNIHATGSQVPVDKTVARRVSFAFELFVFFRRPLALVDGLAQNVLDLSVDTTEFVRCPFFKFLP